MSNLSWQFVVITGIAMMGTVIAGFFSESAIVVIGAIGLLYTQVVNVARTESLGETVEKKTDKLETATTDNTQAIKEAREEANKIAGFISSKVTKTAAQTTEKVVEAVGAGVAKIEETQKRNNGNGGQGLSN